jgi:stage IV sporulation protein FB
MDLGFRLLGLPVQVNVFFLLMSFFLRPQEAHQQPVLTVAWMAIVFLGVLAHELGHALTARGFGQEPAILLHGWGGLTVWVPRGDVGAGKRLLISAAGPAVGILFGGILWLFLAFLPPGLVKTIVWFIVYVNLGWGVLNLLPILPLDGGNVLTSFLELIGLQGARRAVYGFSLVVSIGLLVFLALRGDFVGALLLGLMAFANYQGWQRLAPQPPAPPPDPDPSDPYGPRS